MPHSEIITACIQWVEQHQPDALKMMMRADISKAGIIPFIASTQQIMLMKPVAEHKHLSPPSWQIAKGTRMVQINGTWRDMRKNESLPAHAQLEPLVCTALREGIEEVGLKLENIKSMIDVGVHSFRSVISGTEKQLQLFLCQIRNPDDFLAKSSIATTTADTGWFSLNNLPEDMRSDNVNIIQSITPLLR
jgi:hypothetical protein